MAQTAHAALRAASAAACSLAGSAVGVAAKVITKPIEVAARNPKLTKGALVAGGAGIVGADYLQDGDEYDGFDEDEEQAAP